MKHFLNFVVAACFAALAANAAFADTKTVTWVNAAQNTDGSAIPATGAGSLARTTVEYGTCNAGKTAIASKVGEMFVAPPATTLQVSLVVIQEFCLDAWHSNTYATTFAPSTATTAVVGNSVRSNVAVTQSTPPQPAPPSAVVVGNFIAYQIAQGPGQLTALAFGHVPPGTACDMTQGFDDGIHGMLHVVRDWQSVLMPDGSRNTTRQTVVAACG